MTKYLRGLLPSVLVAILVASAANGALWQWSKTAGSNATADPTINYSEGMAPSALNDSARAAMARVAEYRDDVSGALVTGGTATAYTLTTNQGLAATPVTGQLIAFVPHATNGIASTLTTDGGSTYAIQQSVGVAVGAGTLVQGTPYSLMFNGTAWLLRNVYGNPYSIPLGGLLPYTGATAPNSNFVLPFGQCISRTTYSTYFAQVSTTFGSCDGTTTFGVPDLRGRVIAGLDNIGGSAASRLTTAFYGADPTVMGNPGGSQSHTIATSEMPSHTHTASSVVTDPGHFHDLTGSGVPAGSGNTRASAVYSTTNAGTPGTSTKTTGVTVATTNSNTGGGGAMTIVPPAIVLQFILRVL